MQLHFSEDLSSVPKKFRKKAHKVEEVEPLQEERPASDDIAPKATRPATGRSGKSLPEETFAGKTQAQWEKDLRGREEAMAAVRKQIDDTDVQLKDPVTTSNALREQRKTLLEQFQKMKAEYIQLLDSARKAGLEVKIEE